MPRTELDQLRAELRIAKLHAHQTDAERAEMEAQLHSARAETARARAHAARTHAEAVTVRAALDAVRRLCDLTISSSIRTQAIEQARDTLAAIENVTEGQPAAGDAAWHSVWLHGDWRWLTKNMTTPEREHAADAVARYGTYLETLDGEDRSEEPEGLRWWRD